MAPAWPIRRPGGAVRPAINPAVGFHLPFFFSSAKNCAASSSADPPISPIMIMLSVSSSARNHSSTSKCSVPFIGSPPMPTQVDWPNPTSVVCLTASYVKVPDRDTTPTDPRWWMCPGIIPILQAPGVITPGQLGPTNRLDDPSSALLTLIISKTGMPSVIHTITSIWASIASNIESAANGGGT